MFQRDDGMIEHHARPTPTHDFAHQRPFFGSIAVNGTTFAGGFRVAKTTMVETPVGIFQQGGILRRKFRATKTATAIEMHHQFDDAFLAFYT